METTLPHKQPGSRARLEMILKDAEKDAKNLLQNPAPNAADAAIVRTAITE